MSGFKQTVSGKKESELDKWLEETESQEMDELSSFTNGIRRDIAAVKNAILLDYNNGLAEGSVNERKVVKRIMYGRNSFELLKGKLLRLELKRKINELWKDSIYRLRFMNRYGLFPTYKIMAEVFRCG